VAVRPPSGDPEVLETRLSRVDGQAGELSIGGIRVEDLAPQATFEETAFLLWHGRQPDLQETKALRGRLAEARGFSQGTREVLKAAAAARLSVMDALRLGVDSLALSGAGEPVDVRTAEQIVGVVPALVAAYWRLTQGKEPLVTEGDLRSAEAYLYLQTGQRPFPAAVRGLETYLNTVIDHGLNASTFTARVIASTHSDMVSSVVGALGALKGPLHGGAPGPAIDMVFEILERSRASGRTLEAETESWVREKVEAGGRIMGFGHRVYKVRDPRADVLGAAAESLYLGSPNETFYRQAQAVERVTLDVLEELKPGRHLRTNVEFYTALVLHGVGLPAELFTPTFAVSRVAGWTAHVLEQREHGRLVRPLEKYVGETGRRWEPLPDGMG
jgi:citrate synthase